MGEIRHIKITSVQFKRGNKSALENVLVDDKVLKSGEPCWEMDTNKFKIGDGVSDYADLPYLSDGDTGALVVEGYYEPWDSEHRYGSNFYKDAAHLVPLFGDVKHLFIDIPTRLVYYFKGEDGERFVELVRNATVDSGVPGLIKLYGSSGDNEDGSLTQKAITTRLKKKVEIELEDATPEDPEDEEYCLKMIIGNAD